ncbi:Uncharacterised protein [uncultured archaeon]|nr:Uncharacterised protein [uncultured archaeon]
MSPRNAKHKLSRAGSRKPSSPKKKANSSRASPSGPSDSIPMRDLSADSLSSIPSLAATPIPAPSGELPSVSYTRLSAPALQKSGIKSVPSTLPDPAQPLANSLRRLLPGSVSSGPLSSARFSLPLPLSGSPAQWMQALSDSGFSSSKQSGSRLELELAESLDLHGRPHEFMRLRLEPKQVEVEYSLRADQHPVRRRLQAWQLLLLTLSASGAIHSSPEFSRHLAQLLADALSLLSDDADTLRLKLETVQKQLADAQARLGPLEAQREADAKRALADAQAIQSMQSRIQKLEHLPDSVLEEELMEWLRSHDGSMSVREVSRQLGVGGARVEDMLDKLCKAGRIQRVK